MNSSRLVYLVCFAVTGLLCVMGTAGNATAQPTISVRGNVGASFFRAPETTSIILNSGTNVGVEAEIRLYRGLGITVGGGYDRFTLNEENARIYGETGGDLTFLGGGIGVRYTFENNSDAHPYLAIGAGMYRGRSSNRKEVTDEGELVRVEDPLTITEEGIHIAAGSLFRLNDTYSVFAEPRYMLFDVQQGINRSIRYLTLRLGVDVQLY